MSITADRIEAARRRYVAAMGTDQAGLRYDELREAVRAALVEKSEEKLRKIAPEVETMQ